jgi:hypothetical protein
MSKNVLGSVANSVLRAAAGPTLCYPLDEETVLGIKQPELIADLSIECNVKVSNVQNFISSCHNSLGAVFN